LDEVREAAGELGLPVVIRPSYTMGGLGSGMAHTPAELARLGTAGLAESPVHQVLIEESVLGWKEYELELMRDHRDNVVVVCSIENIDPMGVHTGDSVTVAPAMTLTDREYQHMRDVGIAVLREVPDSPSPRSLRSSRSGMPSMRSPTTSPARPPPASSPHWTTWWSRCPGLLSRSSPAPTRR
jgi:hypothetical protein